MPLTKNTKPEQVVFLGAQEEPGGNRRIGYRAFPMVGQAGPYAAVDLHAGCPIRFVNSGGKITCVKAGGGSYTTYLVTESKVDGFAFGAYLAGEEVCVVELGMIAGYADAAVTQAAVSNLYLSQTAGEFDLTPPFAGALPIGRFITDGKSLFRAASTVKGSLMKVWTNSGI